MSDPEEIRYEMDPEALAALKAGVPELERLCQVYFQLDPLRVTRLVTEAMEQVVALGLPGKPTDTQVITVFALTQMIPLVIREVEKHA